MALEAGRGSPCAGLYWILMLVFIHLASPVTANNLTSSNNTAEPVGAADVVPLENDIVPKSLIAVGILAGAVIIGAIIAKLVDFIHDRKSLRDDASDMSEYTRVLLKKRLALLAFSRNRKEGDGADDEYGDGSGVKLPPELVALKLGKQWSFKASQRRLERERSQASDMEKGSSVGDLDKSGNADLLAFTLSSGQPAVANLVTTSCEVAGVSVSSLSELAVPSQDVLASPGSPVRRVPSLTVDELEDNVFVEEALSPQRARRGSAVRTPTPSMIARVQVGAWDTGQTGSNSGQPRSSSPQAASAGAGQPPAAAIYQPPATQADTATQPPATQPPATQTPATQADTATQPPATQTMTSTTAQSPAQVLALQMSSRPKSSRTRSPTKSANSAGAWLYKDPPSHNTTDLAPVHGATPKTDTPRKDTNNAIAATSKNDTNSATAATTKNDTNTATAATTKKDTNTATATVGDTAATSTATVAAVTIAMDQASGSAVVSSGSMTSIRHDERPQSPLDVPERPANPVPPMSRTEMVTSPPRTPTPIVVSSKALHGFNELVDDEGVVYSCDDKRSTTGAGKGRTDRSTTTKATTNKTAFSSKSDIRKIFQRAPSAKRPQTSKKVTSSNNGTGQASRAGATSAAGMATKEGASGAEAKRPKTAGPIRTGNRPVSAKPSRKITPGVRLKSAKR